MKMTWKEKLFLILAVVGFFATGALYIYTLNVKSAVVHASLVRDSLQGQMRTYIDDNGSLHAQVEVLKINKEMYAYMDKHSLDSLAKAIDVKSKNILQLITSSTSTTGTLVGRVDTTYRVIAYTPMPTKADPFPKIAIDTQKIFSVTYRDRWMELKGTLDRDLFVADYTMKDTLKFVTFTKRSGMFGLGKEKTYLDAKASNPNVTFSNVDKVELENVPSRKWSAGPYIGYGFDGRELHPSIGISVQYSLIRWGK